MKSNITTLFFDFNGVLSHDHFFQGLPNEQQHIYTLAQEHLFTNKELIFSRMRGKISSEKVMKIIEPHTNYSNKELVEIFHNSIKNMKLDQQLITRIQQKKSEGYKLGLITANMLEFSTITIPQYNLSTVFNMILNSYEYGIIKEDNNGQLFDIAIQQIGENNVSNIIHIDDSLSPLKTFSDKGGNIYHYKSFEQFQNDIEKILQ